MDKMLKNDLNIILENPLNVRIQKGNVNGYSIEIEFIQQRIFESYLYKNDEHKRDNDLKNIIKLIKEKINTKK